MVTDYEKIFNQYLSFRELPVSGDKSITLDIQAFKLENLNIS